MRCQSAGSRTTALPPSRTKRELRTKCGIIATKSKDSIGFARRRWWATTPAEDFRAVAVEEHPPLGPVGPRAVKTDHFHSAVRGKSFFLFFFLFSIAFAFWNIIVDRSVHLFVWRIPNQLRQKRNFLRSLTCLYLHHWPPGNQLVSLTDDPNTHRPGACKSSDSVLLAQIIWRTPSFMTTLTDSLGRDS